MFLILAIATMGIAEAANATQESTTNTSAAQILVKESISKSEVTGKALLIQDRLPWNKLTDQKGLQELGIPYDVMNSGSIASHDLNIYKFIIYSSDQTTNFYQNVEDNIYKIEDYVANGGTLIAHVSDYGWGGGTWKGLHVLPANVGHMSYYDNIVYSSESIYIVDPSHPVMAGIPYDYFNGWYYSAHGIFTNIPYNARIVTQSNEYDGGDGPTYIDYRYGNGRVLATTQTLEWKEYNPAVRNEFRLAYGAQASSITVTTPNGGENWARGTSHDITWTSTGTGPTVKIQIYKGGIPEAWDLISSTPNDGVLTWPIWAERPVGADYKIKVIACKGTSSGCSTPLTYIEDMSDNNFAIYSNNVVPMNVNLLKNPGFETSSGSIPKYWSNYQGGTKAIFTYPEAGRTGGKSIAVKYVTKETSKAAIWKQDNVVVTPSKKYKLSGYMKLSGVTGGGNPPLYNGAAIRINWYALDGTLIKMDFITTTRQSGTKGWTKFERIFTAPSNAVTTMIGGDLYGASGKVWFDDMSLVRVS